MPGPQRDDLPIALSRKWCLGQKFLPGPESCFSIHAEHQASIEVHGRQNEILNSSPGGICRQGLQEHTLRDEEATRRQADLGPIEVASRPC